MLKHLSKTHVEVKSNSCGIHQLCEKKESVFATWQIKRAFAFPDVINMKTAKNTGMQPCSAAGIDY